MDRAIALVEDLWTGLPAGDTDFALTAILIVDAEGVRFAFGKMPRRPGGYGRRPDKGRWHVLERREKLFSDRKGRKRVIKADRGGKQYKNIRCKKACRGTELSTEQMQPPLPCIVLARSFWSTETDSLWTMFYFFLPYKSRDVACGGVFSA